MNWWAGILLGFLCIFVCLTIWQLIIGNMGWVIFDTAMIMGYSILLMQAVSHGK